jgi:hypothetical protein
VALATAADAVASALRLSSSDGLAAFEDELVVVWLPAELD